MKLLFDQNLSFKLIGLLGGTFPGCAHVREFGLQAADDSAVWIFAKARGYIIVSKDDDFHQRSFLYGAPPKVIWVRVGNGPTQRIVDLLVGRAADIRSFAADPRAAFLVLT